MYWNYFYTKHGIDPLSIWLQKILGVIGIDQSNYKKKSTFLPFHTKCINVFHVLIWSLFQLLGEYVITIKQRTRSFWHPSLPLFFFYIIHRDLMTNIFVKLVPWFPIYWWIWSLDNTCNQSWDQPIRRRCPGLRPTHPKEMSRVETNLS